MNILVSNDLLYNYIDAIEFATRAHAGQSRRFGDKEPYVAHPIRVSKHILQATEGWPIEKRMPLATAGVLHDVLEDTPIKDFMIENAFGYDIKVLVESVTKNTALPKADKEMEYLLRFQQSSVETVIIKLADRLDNLISMRKAPLDFKRKYLLNTESLMLAIPEQAKKDKHVGALNAQIADLVEEYKNGM